MGLRIPKISYPRTRFYGYGGGKPQTYLQFQKWVVRLGLSSLFSVYIRLFLIKSFTKIYVNILFRISPCVYLCVTCTIKIVFIVSKCFVSL